MNIDITSIIEENSRVYHLPCAIILCRPEESRNVGSACRAMKNMACHDLRIVGDKASYNDAQVRTLALHAADVWESARFFEPTCDGLASALADCTVTAGTTRRMGQKRKSWGMTPEQFAQSMIDAGAGRIGIVFGNERTGLTDEELDRCALAVNIPTSEEFPSLNLSHAVQLVTYAMFRAYDGRSRGYQAITEERVESLRASVSESIDRVGLFGKTRDGVREENDRFLASVFARAALSESEAQRMEKLFRKLAYVRTGSAPAE